MSRIFRALLLGIVACVVNGTANAALFEINYLGEIWQSNLVQRVNGTSTNQYNTMIGQGVSGTFIMNTAYMNPNTTSTITTGRPGDGAGHNPPIVEWWNQLYNWDQNSPESQFLTSRFTVNGKTTETKFLQDLTPNATQLNRYELRDRHWPDNPTLDWEQVFFEELYESDLSGGSLPNGHFLTQHNVAGIFRAANLFDSPTIHTSSPHLPNVVIQDSIPVLPNFSTAIGFGNFNRSLLDDTLQNGSTETYNYQIAEFSMQSLIAGEAALSDASSLVVDEATNQYFSAGIVGGSEEGPQGTLTASAFQGEVTAEDLGIDEGLFDALEGSLQLWDIDYEGELGPGEEIELVFYFNPIEFTVEEIAALDVYHFIDGAWTALDGVKDINAGTITVTTTSFSPYSVGGALAAPDPSNVPETSTLSLMALALLGVIVRRRRTRGGR